ncbi:MAG: Rpn family recombination-promoting nuclease/putative transposase [Fibrobacter sp.]|nr:Rpn family recombination-promoting nuclease/putative transposase [Fibrobacter sp.]
MNRSQYAEMLKDIHETRTSGGDVAACINKYREKYRYVYVYNDACFKKIFGALGNKPMAASFLNAVLKLEGGDCIRSLDFVDPEVPGGPYVKSVTSDLVAENQDKNRIVIEVQHRGDSEFKDRLVFYTACHTLQNKVPGEAYELRQMDFIALQMFDTYQDSKSYRHCVQLKNQDNELFFGKHRLTIVEVDKFLKGKYDADESRLANWLRAIDRINNEELVEEVDDPYLKVLQNAAKLCNFDMGYLLTEARNMTDRAYERSMDRKEARAEGLAEGRAEGRSEGRSEGRQATLDVMRKLGVPEEKIREAEAMLKADV